MILGIWNIILMHMCDDIIWNIILLHMGNDIIWNIILLHMGDDIIWNIILLHMCDHIIWNIILLHMPDDLCNLEICKKMARRMMLPLILTIQKKKTTTLFSNTVHSLLNHFCSGYVVNLNDNNNKNQNKIVAILKR